jgi:signal transduction histidine kinase/CheY-like chemotaxis protein
MHPDLPMQQTLDRTRDTLASAFDALAEHARRQQHLYSVTIAALIAIVLCSGALLAGLAADRHLDSRRRHVSHYAGEVSQLLHNESSFLRRTVLSIRYHLDAPAPDLSRDAGFNTFRRTGGASIHVDAVRKDYHLLASGATRQAWGARLPARFVRLRQIALATMATQQAFDLDHAAYAVSLDEDSAVVIRQPEADARAPLALDPALIPLLRARLTQALLERTGNTLPARDEQVWVGPLRDPVDDSPIMVLAGAAYAGAAGDTPTMLVVACVPVQTFLAGLKRPLDPALLALFNHADELIDLWPRDSTVPAASVSRLAAQARQLSDKALPLTRSGVLLARPLPVGFGLLAHHLPYRLLGAALAPELAGIAGAMLLLIGAIVLAARYWSRQLLRRTVLDCTAQQALQQQLRSAQQATEAMMRVRSTFFAAMSHEIRTPLNALLGNLELLARSSGLELHAPRLRALDTAADALRRIVNDVLDFSKVDAGQLTLINAPFRLIDALESLALSYAPMVAGRPIRCCLHLSPSLDTEVTGDRTRLVQILNNLLNNAFKFTASGRITMSGEFHQDEHGMQRLVCRVSDSGIGMPPALAARVFQPFVQGDTASASRYGGTGLGLAICARLCELMGGSIRVDSVQDVGSAFTVSVPLPPSTDAQQASAPAAAARHGRAMVLCQDARTGDSLEAWLNAAGWRTDVLASAATARESLQRHAPRVMVATDEYPLTALAALRDAAPVPVVWVTAQGPHRPRQAAPGILEVSVFSHRALLDCVAQAAGGAMPVPVPALVPALDLAPGNTPAGRDLPAPSAARLTILVAEDNPLNQALITEQLQALGCEPIIAGNGKQALAVLETTRVDAVLTDLQMPGMDGQALLRAIRAQHPGLPVLAFSAHACSDPVEDWRLRGFSGYIAKPASLQDLEACLRDLPRSRDDAVPSENDGVLAATAEARDRRRYEDMLRQQLRQDLPALAHILARQDLPALQHWAHAVAGAFMIVRRRSIVRACQALEARCSAGQAWTPATAAAAEALHKRLQRYAQALAGA